LASGFLIREPRISGSEWMALPAGVVIVYLSRWIEALPGHVYAVEDYWHASPEFFMLRVGLLLGVLGIAYGWCSWGAGAWGFIPLISLGRPSLLGYWWHIVVLCGRVVLL